MKYFVFFIFTFILILFSNVFAKSIIYLDQDWEINFKNKTYDIDEIIIPWASLDFVPENKEVVVVYKKDFFLESKDITSEDVTIILPPFWGGVEIFFNNINVTPYTFSAKRISRVYASKIIKVSSKIINKDSSNNLKIVTNSIKELGGFKSSKIYLNLNDKNNGKTFVINLVKNDVHNFFVIFSILMGIFCLLLPYFLKGYHYYYLFLGVAAFAIIPHHLLTTDFYTFFPLSVEDPFRIQLFFQALGWVCCGIFYGLSSKVEIFERILRNKIFIIFLVVYFIVIMFLALFFEFKIFKSFLIPIFSVPILWTPYLIIKTRFAGPIRFLALTLAIFLGFISFISEALNLNQFYIGYSFSIALTVGFFEFLNSSISSMWRDKAAANLFSYLLPKSVHEQISFLLDKRKNLSQIRESLRGETVITTIFCDICSYGKMANIVPPKFLNDAKTEVFQFLSNIFKKYRIELIKTIGDSAHFCGGLWRQDVKAHGKMATNCLESIVEILDNLDKLASELNKMQLPSVKIKISASIGILEFGLEGAKDRFSFDVFGPSIILAKRMEEAMNENFYKKYSMNVALVAKELCDLCENIAVRKRFQEIYEFNDKHNQHYITYIGRQYEKPVDHQDFLKGFYGQFAHDDESKESKRNTEEKLTKVINNNYGIKKYK